MSQAIIVQAVWDDEAKVYYIEESNLPGLAAEGATLEELDEKLKVLIPELMDLNGHLFPDVGAGGLPVHLMASKMECLRTA